MSSKSVKILILQHLYIAELKSNKNIGKKKMKQNTTKENIIAQWS